MAVGNTALVTQDTFNAQLGVDAQYLRGVYDWLKRKSAEYTVNAGSSAILEAPPYNLTAADANTALLFMGDLNRIITLFEGGVPSASNIVDDLAALLGLG